MSLHSESESIDLNSDDDDEEVPSAFSPLLKPNKEPDYILIVFCILFYFYKIMKTTHNFSV